MNVLNGQFFESLMDQIQYAQQLPLSENICLKIVMKQADCSHDGAAFNIWYSRSYYVIQF